MNKDFLIGTLIGGMIGSAVGGWIHKSKAEYDADLVAYQNMAPTVVVEPTASFTLTPVPVAVHNCLTPDPTETPEPASVINARKEWKALQKSEMKEHATDFIPMPYPKSTYQGVPVEFITDGPYKWENHDEVGSGPPDNSKREKSLYEKFYSVQDDEKVEDKTTINGFVRRSLFIFLDDDQFKSLHKPFYGIKVIYFPYGDGIIAENRPSPRWIYIVWSVKHKAPIPFPYPSQAIKLIKRQQERKQ